MITSIEIFSKAHDYIENKISLRELESWLVSMLPIYLSNPASEATELASIIELGLAEIDASIRTERGLKRLIKNHLAYNTITSLLPYLDPTYINLTVASTSSTEATNLELNDPLPSWSTVPQVEYV